jgi:hypothetical protein
LVQGGKVCKKSAMDGLSSYAKETRRSKEYNNLLVGYCYLALYRSLQLLYGNAYIFSFRNFDTLEISKKKEVGCVGVVVLRKITRLFLKCVIYYGVGHQN